jgi:hypothetical protein
MVSESPARGDALMTDNFQIPTVCDDCGKPDDVIWNVVPCDDPKQVYFLCLNCIAHIGPDGFVDGFGPDELATIESRRLAQASSNGGVR